MENNARSGLRGLVVVFCLLLLFTVQPLTAQIVANTPVQWGGVWNNQSGKTAAGVEVVLDAFASNISNACQTAVPFGGAPCLEIIDQTFTTADIGRVIDINSQSALFQPIMQAVQSSFGLGNGGKGSDGNGFGSSTCCSPALASQITAITITVDNVCFSASQGCGKVFNNGGTPDNAILGHITFVSNIILPVLTSIVPNSAEAGDPAFNLTLNGTNFLVGDVVLWNGSPLATTFVSASQLTAAVPAALIATTGSATVMVQDPSSNKSNGQTFTINAPTTPTITNLNPSAVVVMSPAFVLTVNGTGFESGSTVLWNGTALTTTFVNATQLTAAVPATLVAAVANISVTVQNPSSVMSNAATFTVSAVIPAPSIVSLNPASVAAGGAAFTLTVNGANFSNGAVVQWNSTALTTTFVNGSQLTAAVTAALIASPGTVNITVVNPNMMTSNIVTFTITALSLPHFGVGADFMMSFYVINSGSQTGNFTITFYDDTGKLAPIQFTGLNNTATFSDSVVANGAKYYQAGTFTGPLTSGSAVIMASPGITIQAILRRLGVDGNYYEAAIPATAGYNEIQIPFDATTFAATGAQIFTGFAVANLDAANPANVVCTAKDPVGNLIPNAITVPTLNPLGHYSNYLFPALNGLRGTIDCTSNTKIGGVALLTLGGDSISTLPVVPIR